MLDPTIDTGGQEGASSTSAKAEGVNKPNGKAAEAAAIGPISIKLRKAIKTHETEKLETLVFREPTVIDIERCGDPVQLDFSKGWPPAPVFDEKKMTMMMATLANVAPSSIHQMHPKDWITAAWSVAGFFIPDWETANL